MNSQLLEQLSKAVGVELKVRDNDKLKEETIAHLENQLIRKEQAARNSGAACVDSGIDSEGAIKRFYDGANRKD